MDFGDGSAWVGITSGVCPEGVHLLPSPRANDVPITTVSTGCEARLFGAVCCCC